MSSSLNTAQPTPNTAVRASRGGRRTSFAFRLPSTPISTLIALAVLVAAAIAAPTTPELPTVPSRPLPPTSQASVSSTSSANGTGTGSQLRPNIVGGASTGSGKYPWVAFLGFYDKANQVLSPACTGALITPTLIITAAHCAKEPVTNWIVWINRYDYGFADAKNGIYFAVKRIWTPPSWNPATAKSDIALFQIELSTAATSPLGNAYPFGNPSGRAYPRPVAINLGFPNTPAAGSRVTAAGWGLTRNSAGQLVPSSFLQEVDLPVVAQAKCATFFAGIDSSVVCAGGEPGKNVCKGDSGGPLFIWDDNGNPVVVGVTSKGPTNCGQTGIPAIWTRVSAYAAWIASVIAASDADAAKGGITVTDSFARMRAPVPVIGGVQQGLVRPIRPRVTKIGKRAAAAPTAAPAA